MNLLENGLCFQSYGWKLIGNLWHQNYHITAPPHLKNSYMSKAKYDLLEEIKEDVLTLPCILTAKVYNRAVHLVLKNDPNPEFLKDRYINLQAIIDLLLQRSASWQKGERYVSKLSLGCLSLQQIILDKFQEDPAFKLKCCVHHAAVQGANNTLNMARLISEWSSVAKS